jgi:hypothetical protein
MDVKVRNLSRPWTEDEDKKLLTIAAQKRAPLSIALALRRTKGAVNSRLSILRTAEVLNRQKDMA